MAVRFNTPPNWPPPPAGWQPPPGWMPDRAWGPPPPGWRLWSDDGDSKAEVGGARAQVVTRWMRGHKILSSAGALLAVLLLIAALSESGTPTSPLADEQNNVVGSSTQERSVKPPAVANKTATATPTATPSPTPVITTEEVVETEVLPFAAVSREDSSMAAGTSAVTIVGVPGTRTVTYSVTYTDGVETARTVVSDEVTTPAIDQVTSVGTYVELALPPPPPPAADESGGCDPNYSGCVPIDSDVDCAGGSGNGPSYADGPVNVVGNDIYGLDNDNDGVGCES